MIKINRIVPFYSLLIVVFISSIAVAEAPPKNSDLYPTTPEGVVEALVKADFDGLSDELIGDINKRLKYFVEAYPTGSDGFPVTLKYKVIKLTKTTNEVSVKVVFDILGYMTGYEILQTNKKTEEETFHLRKEKGSWKITYPVSQPRVSVKTAIKILETELERPYYKKHPKLVEKIKKNIAILKKNI